MRFESLENRHLLAADMLASIAGVVFNDVNDNGAFDGSDLAIENATVSLTKDGDPGFLMTDTTDAQGEYRFDGLGEGTYFVTQFPVDGLFQRPDVTTQTIVKSVGDATGISGTVIDSFSTQQSVSAIPSATPDFDFVAAAEAIGGERELFASLTSPTGEVATLVNPGGINPVLQFDSDAASAGTRNVVWDGDADGGAVGVDFGLSEDLTAGGADALVVRVPFDDIPVDITVRVYKDAGNYSDAVISLPGLIFIGTEAFILPYDQFVATGTGADFTNVTAIELFIDPDASAPDVQIDYIGTIGPMTADFANLEMGIAIEKATNGEDADTPTGPILVLGSTADFTYEVSNTGNVALANIIVADDNGTPGDTGDDFNPDPVMNGIYNIGDTNTNDLLDTDETWQYTADRVVTAGQYTNIATVTGEDSGVTASPATVTNNDPSNHFGSDPGIAIEKATNGEDADTPLGPVISVGETANFTYAVSNTGNVALTNVVIVDDNGTPGDTGDDFNPAPVLSGGFNIGDTNTDNLLDVDETWQYTASRTVTAGQFTNIGSVFADEPDTDVPVFAEDPSNHFGADAAIDIQKRTNGFDADTATGPFLTVGSTADFTYEVQSTGSGSLQNIVVEDDNGTPGDTGDDFNPAPVLSGGFNIGDTNTNDFLDPGEVWQYEASRVVTAGQYTNIGNVEGQDPDTSEVVGDNDPSNHFGSDPDIVIEKATNGEDADTPTGPELSVGETADFTYAVSNTGNVPLANIVVVDDNGTPGDTGDDFNPDPVLSGGFNVGDTNTDSLLDTDEVWQYTADRVVTEGQYANIATVSGEDQNISSEVPPTVSDSDPSHHVGIPDGNPAVAIQKLTNGEDADTPTGPFLATGISVAFTYEVSNTGDVPLTIVELTDDAGTPGDTGDDFTPLPVLSGGFNIGDTNTDDLLDIDEVWRYVASTIVTPGQYANIGSVTAQDPTTDEEVTATDPSHHFGAEPGVQIEKATNGEDADLPTGPEIQVGDTANFTYAVSNTGNVPVAITDVTDDAGTPGDVGDDFTPDAVEIAGFNVGDLNTDGLLDTNEVWQYTSDIIVTAGQYTNIASVTVEDEIEQVATDEDPSNHFGVENLASLAGFVFADLNNDGFFDETDLPIAGVQVTLSRLDAEAADIVLETAADGSYEFTDLLPGTYRVTESQPAGYIDGQKDGFFRSPFPPLLGTVVNDYLNDQITDIDIDEGDELTNFNFGELPFSKRFFLASSAESNLDEDVSEIE